MRSLHWFDLTYINNFNYDVLKKAQYPVQSYINVIFCLTKNWAVHIFNKDEVPIREKQVTALPPCKDTNAHFLMARKTVSDMSMLYMTVL